MKNIIKNPVLIFCLLFSISEISYSQNPEYTLTAKNFNRTASDSVTFDIYLLHTNPSSVPVFNYSLGQYYFDFNPGIANGGTLTYRIIGSDLPQNAQPRNPTVFNNQLRLVSNASLGGNGPTISASGDGTLIVRMSLRTSASAFASNQNLNLAWRNSSSGNPFTKLFAYSGSLSVDITNSANHFIDDMIGVNQISTEVPAELKLFQNYPNPFNPSTRINFTLPKSGNVSLKVYDISGKLVENLINGKLNAGRYEISFDGSELSSGIYFYRIQINDFADTKRMILVK